MKMFYVTDLNSLIANRKKCINPFGPVFLKYFTNTMDMVSFQSLLL